MLAPLCESARHRDNADQLFLTAAFRKQNSRDIRDWDSSLECHETYRVNKLLVTIQEVLFAAVLRIAANHCFHGYDFLTVDMETWELNGEV